MSGGEPERRFAGRAEAYARWRPGYPPSLLDLLRGEVDLEEGHAVADIGSGTGLLSRLFLDHGNPVRAVEPDPGMREIAEAELGGTAGFLSVAGSAEETGLEGGSVELVVAGQAFHWFDREAARDEFRRILRDPRRVALIWYTRVIDRTPFMAALEALLLEHGTDYGSVRHDRIGEDGLRAFFASRYRRRTLPHGQVLDREGLRGRVRSMSYVPAAGEAGHEELMSAVDRLFRSHARDGRVRIEYDLEVHLGRV